MRRNLIRLLGLLAVCWIPVAAAQADSRGVFVSPTTGVSVGSVWGVFIGVSQYQQKDLNLKYADKDAQALHAFFVAQFKGRVPADQFRLLTNSQATRGHVLKEVSEVLRLAQPEDLVILSLALHGLPDASGNDLYFLSYNADANLPEDQGISRDDLLKQIARSKARKIVLLIDACHAGAFGSSPTLLAMRGANTADINRMLVAMGQAQDGIAVLSASSAAERSQEGQQFCGGHGAFTCALLNGLKGAADGDGNGLVQMRELYDHTYREVKRLTTGYQNPEIQGRYDNGLPLAITGKGATKPTGAGSTTPKKDVDLSTYEQMEQQAQEAAKREQTWTKVQSIAVQKGLKAEKRLTVLDKFLQDFAEDNPHRSEAEALKQQIAQERKQQEAQETERVAREREERSRREAEDRRREEDERLAQQRQDREQQEQDRLARQREEQARQETTRRRQPAESPQRGVTELPQGLPADVEASLKQLEKESQRDRKLPRPIEEARARPNLGYSQEAPRGVELVKKEPEAVLKELYGKSWAIVVGINHYPTGGRQFPDLQAAVPDAQRVSAKLKEMGFEVRTLLDKDATRKNIKKILVDDVGIKAQADDRIVFFFAGHGATREKADGSHMGYILPHDYDPEDHHSSSISMQEFRDISAQIKAKHMLYVMDSSFSGGLLQGRRQVSVTGSGFQYLKNLTQNRAHVVITAGGKDQTVKEVGGSGIFTRIFLDALSNPDNKPWSQKGYVTAMDLASYVKKRIPDFAPDQSPQYGHLDGEGDVVLALFKPMGYGDRPAGLSPDIEERLKKLAELEGLEREREALRKEKERLQR